MMRTLLMVACLGAVTAVGCHSDRPHDYGQMRPEPGDLDRRDRGLQSADVMEASEKVAQELLQLPAMNQPTMQTIVVTDIENDTSERYFNYDIFLRRLETQVGKYGSDRIMLVDRKARLQRSRSAELDLPMDEFGQGDGTGPRMSRVQPEWELWGRFTNLPNRGTDYYFAEFVLTNLRSGQKIPLGFDVRVGR